MSVASASLAPTYVLLYVRDPIASADFYAARLGRAPVERSETFALLLLDGGHKLGLWRRDGVIPAVPAAAAPLPDFELCLTVGDRAAVDALHADWRAREVAMALAPTALDFGYGFVACDPDGYRLRVFAPEPGPGDR